MCRQKSGHLTRLIREFRLGLTLTLTLSGSALGPVLQLTMGCGASKASNVQVRRVSQAALVALTDAWYGRIVTGLTNTLTLLERAMHSTRNPLTTTV